MSSLPDVDFSYRLPFGVDVFTQCVPVVSLFVAPPTLYVVVTRATPQMHLSMVHLHVFGKGTPAHFLFPNNFLHL